MSKHKKRIQIFKKKLFIQNLNRRKVLLHKTFTDTFKKYRRPGFTQKEENTLSFQIYSGALLKADRLFAFSTDILYGDFITIFIFSLSSTEEEN